MNINSTPSLSDAIAARFGSRSVCQGILKKTAPVPSNRALMRLLHSYLDETKKAAYSPPPVNIIPASRYAADVVEGLAPQRPGIDYVPYKGGLHIFGYLNKILREICGDAESLTEEERLWKLSEWWRKSRANHATKAHHVIFSIDPRTAAVAGELGIPIDLLILSSSVDGLTAYNDRFYPGSSIGWILGPHHDKHHPHGHALIFPTTSSGRRLNLSNDSQALINKKPIRIHFLGALGAGYRSSISRQTDLIHGIDIRGRSLDLKPLVAIGGMASVWDKEIQDSNDAVDFNKGIQWLDARLERHDLGTQFAELPAQLSTTPAWFPMPGKALPQIVKGLRAVADQHNRYATSLKLEREALEKVFAERRSSPDRYQLRTYVRGGPCITPSGTKSFIISSLPKGATWDQRYTSFSKISDVIADRLERIDSADDHHSEVLPKTHIITPQKTVQTLTRAFEAMGYTVPMILALLKSLGIKDPALTARITNHSEWLSMEGARSKVSQILNECILAQANDHHTATADELIDRFCSDVIARKLGFESDKEAEYEATLPASKVLIPSTTNFFERETRIPDAGSIEKLLKGKSAEYRKLTVQQWQIPPAINPSL